MGDATVGLESFTEEENLDKTRIASVNTFDSVAIRSMMYSLGKLRVVDLQECLKKRGMKSSGTKSILKDRLLKSFMY